MIKMRLMMIIFLSSLVTFGNSQSGALNEDEKRDVLYLLEEEKLAMDVYDALGEKWESRIFDNIKASEERHLASVKRIAEENDITIPTTVTMLKRGVFEDEALQAIYNELIEAGNLSLTAALEVGAKIEELDIKDLNAAIANTGSDALINMYSSLKSASENHLRAFVRNLDKQGLEYAPVILSRDYYDKIIKREKVKGNCCQDSTGKESFNGKGKNRPVLWIL